MAAPISSRMRWHATRYANRGGIENLASYLVFRWRWEKAHGSRNTKYGNSFNPYHPALNAAKENVVIYDGDLVGSIPGTHSLNAVSRAHDITDQEVFDSFVRADRRAATEGILEQKGNDVLSSLLIAAPVAIPVALAAAATAGITAATAAAAPATSAATLPSSIAAVEGASAATAVQAAVAPISSAATLSGGTLATGGITAGAGSLLSTIDGASILSGAETVAGLVGTGITASQVLGGEPTTTPAPTAVPNTVPAQNNAEKSPIWGLVAAAILGGAVFLS